MKIVATARMEVSGDTTKLSVAKFTNNATMVRSGAGNFHMNDHRFFYVLNTGQTIDK